MRIHSSWRFLIVCLLVLGLISSLAATVAEAAVVLRQGMQGEDVVKLQTKLREYGYYDDALDGKFGINTKLALMDFQADCGLETDGVAGTQTIEAIKNFRMQNAASRGQNNSRQGWQLVSFAQQFAGIPYVWAGTSPSGFDCSGFIYYIFLQQGIVLPRMADEQFAVGTFVARNQLLPGDLVFFSTYEPGASHVGLYIGHQQFIHASSGAGCVVVTSLNSPYYLERYLGARRMVK